MKATLRRVRTMYRNHGAQPGNQNAKRDNKRDALLSVKCRKGDKARWVRAANRAHRAGLIDGVEKSVLAAWVIHTLNKAAEESRPRAKAS